MKAKPAFTIRMNMAQSLDGHIVDASGGWSSGSAEDRRRMDKLRSWADCVVVSRHSLVTDNPNLYVRNHPEKKSHPRPVVVMRSAGEKIPVDLRFLKPPHPAGEFWLLDQAAQPCENFSFIAGGPQKSAVAGQWQQFYFKNVREIAESLAARGYGKILLEGGGRLNRLFLEENLVDEIYFTLLPRVIGGEGPDRIFAPGSFFTGRNFHLVNVERRHDEVFFRYRR